MLRLCVSLSTLVCLVASRSTGGERPSELIDYETCYWVDGGEGEEVTCDAGYVGTGACGSETMENCNGRSTSLRCCLIKRMLP